MVFLELDMVFHLHPSVTSVELQPSSVLLRRAFIGDISILQGPVASKLPVEPAYIFHP